MTDKLISLQAAIDGVKTLHDVAWKNWHEPTLSPNAVLDMLMELPSAQPEIVRCKDCVYFPEGTGANHDLEFPGEELKCPCECDDYWYSWKPADDWFCGNGKRKENDS
jgi:hypothetical protein